MGLEDQRRTGHCGGRRSHVGCHDFKLTGAPPLLSWVVIALDPEMPNAAAKVSSAYLTSDAMRSFLAALPSAMQEIYGDRPLIVFYGSGCRLHMDLCFKPMQWPLHLFNDFLTQSLDQRIFEFGQADLLIESPDSKLQILICHELDIHLDGVDDRAMAAITAGFPDLDFRTAAGWETPPPHDAHPGPSTQG